MVFTALAMSFEFVPTVIMLCESWETDVAIAPVFGHKSINGRLRVLIAACISLTVFMAMDPEMPEYSTVFGFTFLLLKEAAVGLALGFVASLVMAIITMAGEFIDREIGLDAWKLNASVVEHVEEKVLEEFTGVFLLTYMCRINK